MDQNPEITPGNAETEAVDEGLVLLEDENGEPLTDDFGVVLEV